MLLSIVTVNYNNHKGLLKTYESIRQLLKFKNVEWIIVDASSTDSTGQLLKTFLNEDYKVISETDEGIYDGMNKGIKLSVGKFIWFLNSGDAFTRDIAPSKLLLHLEAKDIDAACFLAKWDSGRRFNNKILLKALKLPNHQSLIYKRQYAYDNSFLWRNFPISADIVHKYELLKKYRVAHFDQVLVEAEDGGVSVKKINIHQYIQRVNERVRLHNHLDTGRLNLFWSLIFSLKLLMKLDANIFK